MEKGGGCRGGSCARPLWFPLCLCHSHFLSVIPAQHSLGKLQRDVILSSDPVIPAEAGIQSLVVSYTNSNLYYYIKE